MILRTTSKIFWKAVFLFSVHIILSINQNLLCHFVSWEGSAQCMG